MKREGESAGILTFVHYHWNPCDSIEWIACCIAGQARDERFWVPNCFPSGRHGIKLKKLKGNIISYSSSKPNRVAMLMLSNVHGVKGVHAAACSFANAWHPNPAIQHLRPVCSRLSHVSPNAVRFDCFLKVFRKIEDFGVSALANLLLWYVVIQYVVMLVLHHAASHGLPFHKAGRAHQGMGW